MQAHERNVNTDKYVRKRKDSAKKPNLPKIRNDCSGRNHLSKNREKQKTIDKKMKIK